MRRAAIVWAMAIALPATALAQPSCRPVTVVAEDTREPLRGVEDIAVDRESGVAYLSATDRWSVEAELSGRSVSRTTQGGIFALRLASLAGEAPERIAAVPLTRAFSAETDFHPHGIDLHVASGGARTLFAVNHRHLRGDDGWRTEHTVEAFDLRGGMLVHRGAQAGTVRDPLLVSPNDVAATGARAFYVTNDHGSGGGIDRALEDVFKRGLGNALHYDPARPPSERMRVVAGAISFANGVAVARDGRTLYVASSRDKAILLYDPGRGANAAPQTRPRRVIPLSFGPDNLTWGPEGRLYVAGHPEPIRFALYANTARWPLGVRSAPSRAVSLDAAAPDPQATLETVLDDGGRLLSGASVAAAVNGVVLVGAVFADRIAVCRR